MPAKERNLFESIASFQALYEASLRAARGKRAKPGAAAFLVNLESGAARSILARTLIFRCERLRLDNGTPVVRQSG